jgi:hypothetical protein
VLDNWITEPEFVEQARARKIKMSRRTARKWRQRRLVPFPKINNNVILYPKDWADALKIIKARNA